MTAVPTLARMTLGEAEDGYNAGTLTQVEYEAYRRAWAMGGGARMGYRGARGWTQPSTDQAVELLAAEIVAYATKAS